MTEAIKLLAADDSEWELELERVNRNGNQVVLRFVDPARKLAWVVTLPVVRVERI